MFKALLRLKKNDGQDGFTLVEVMVVVIFVGIISIGLSELVVGLRDIGNYARRETQATLSAEDKLEELRNLPFNLIVDDPDFTDELPSDLLSPTASVDVTVVSSILKQIDITITYQEKGETRTHTFRSYIGNPGITK